MARGILKFKTLAALVCLHKVSPLRNEMNIEISKRRQLFQSYIIGKQIVKVKIGKIKFPRVHKLKKKNVKKMFIIAIKNYIKLFQVYLQTFPQKNTVFKFIFHQKSFISESKRRLLLQLHINIVFNVISQF